MHPIMLLHFIYLNFPVTPWRGYQKNKHSWYNQLLSPLDVFYERVLKREAWFESQGYIFGPAFLEDVDENYRWE